MSYRNDEQKRTAIPRIAVMLAVALCACGGPHKTEAPSPTANPGSAADATSSTDAGAPSAEPSPAAADASDDALWRDGCTHALAVYQRERGADDAKTARGRDACIRGLTQAAAQQGRALADAAARCFANMRTMSDMVPCMRMLVDAGVVPQIGSKRYGGGSDGSR